MRHRTGCGVVVFAALIEWGCANIDGAALVESDPMKREARRGFAYLNRVRANPPKFSSEVGVDLSGVAPGRALKWHPVLERSAQARAEDLARRSYFSHVNPEGIGPNFIARQMGYKFPAWWAQEKDANTIESISAGVGDGVEAIKKLIADRGANPPGHRIHLLGMDEFFASHKDGAVGMAHNPETRFRYFLVVQTAVSE